ncbi:MAG TPA: hypothetical protein DEO68_12640 [Halomonas campaniensis]|uniref:Uncharacterized protein n=1 Tax=Halomonas campaniensis TaxID=213554 RepID=A0A3D0KIF8_9GAMM|nr:MULTISPECIES: hypothetical protein [unclassified Halomonas]HCA02991.1 hypothetical protein [Halomonas campaniensis]
MSYSAISGMLCSGSEPQAVFLRQELHYHAEVPFGFNVFIIGLRGHSDTESRFQGETDFILPTCTGGTVRARISCNH